MTDALASALTVMRAHRLVPLVVLDDPRDAAPLAAALKAGGLPVAEVAFRTPAAEACLREMASDTDMFVGAGTVIDVDQVDRAAAAGARFLVSPGLSPAVVRRAAEVGLPILPGVATATELMAAIDLGIRAVKLFPAGLVGGAAMLDALAAPFPQVSFVPTGGVGADDLADYLSRRAVLAVGGSWMVARALVSTGDWAEVRRRTAAAVAVAQARSVGDN